MKARRTQPKQSLVLLLRVKAANHQRLLKGHAH